MAILQANLEKDLARNENVGIRLLIYAQIQGRWGIEAGIGWTTITSLKEFSSFIMC